MKALLFTALLCCLVKPPKTTILRFGQGSTHARSIQDFSKNELLIGTNEGKYLLVSKNDHKPVTMYLPCSNQVIKEIRDVDKNQRFLFFMQSNDSSHLLRLDWKGQAEKLLAFTHHEKPVFLDGIDMKDSLGFLIGDPVDGDFALFRTTNYGETWEKCPGKVTQEKNEAAYAASGTTNAIIDRDFVFVSGGETTRFIWSSDFGNTWQSSNIPYESCRTCGAYSLAFKNRNELVVVGGDYTQATKKNQTCFYSKDGGKSWSPAKTPPNGYRSCVLYKNGIYYTCGTNGIDYSKDGGNTWHGWLTENGLSMCTDQHFLYISCTGGKILKVKLLK